MTSLLRIPLSAEPTNFLLQMDLLLCNLVYHGSAEYSLFTTFVMAITSITGLWSAGLLQKTLPQIVAVVFFFTWPFNEVSTIFGAPLSLNELLFVRVLTGFATIKFLSLIPSSFPGSFSSGELGITLQLSISFLAASVACLLNSHLDLHYSFCGYDYAAKTIRLLSLGLAFYAANCTWVAVKFKSSVSGLLFVAFAYSIGLAYFSIFQSIDVEPFQWLIGFITRSQIRKTLMLKWAGILSINLLFAVFWSNFTSGKAGPKIRKFFHLGISAVFVIGIREDPELLSFCSACLLLVFLVLESWRICKMWPLSSALDKCFDSFRDEKDPGILTTTHMYLLIGASLPLWLLPAGNRTSLATYSGVIAVGFGDTAASIVGSYAKHRWPGSKKSIEGTIAALIAQLLASVGIWCYLSPGQLLSASEVLILTLVSALVALIEAKTKEIDNLVLPLYHHILMLCAKTYFPRF